MSRLRRIALLALGAYLISRITAKRQSKMREEEREAHARRREEAA